MAKRFSRAHGLRFVTIALIVLGLVTAVMMRGKRVLGGKTQASLTLTRQLLGTWVSITVVAADEKTSEAHIEAAFDRIAELDRLMSTYKEDSELSRVNRRAGEGPVAVSEDLFAAISAGVKWCRLSHGAFDIAVSPLLDLWRTCARADRLPTQEEIAALQPLFGAGRIELDAGARSVKFPVEGMRLDLGGLGKGYCADEVVELLKERGVRKALVAVAGDVYALGTRQDGLPWRVGVQDPRRPDSRSALLTVLELSDMAVSTSGNYQRYVEIQGRRYSHIVDPRTGKTADRVPSVTVIARDTLISDILGTALSVLGVEEGIEFVEEMPSVEALFVTIEDPEQPQFVRSSGFARYETASRHEPDYLK